MYTIEQLIEFAVHTATAKNNNGLLFHADTDLRELNWSKGDPETLYSITAMYAQFSHNTTIEDAEDKILNVLAKKFPEKI